MTLTRQAQSVTGVRRRSAVLCPGRHRGRPGHRADAGRATPPVEEGPGLCRAATPLEPCVMTRQMYDSNFRPRSALDNAL